MLHNEVVTHLFNGIREKFPEVPWGTGVSKEVKFHLSAMEAGGMSNCGLIALSVPQVEMPYGVEPSVWKKLYDHIDPKKEENIRIYTRWLLEKLKVYGKSQYVFSDEISIKTSGGVKFKWADIAPLLPGSVTYGPVTENHGHYEHFIQVFIYVPSGAKIAALGSLTEHDGSCKVDDTHYNLLQNAHSFRKVYAGKKS